MNEKSFDTFLLAQRFQIIFQMTLPTFPYFDKFFCGMVIFCLVSSSLSSSPLGRPLKQPANWRERKDIKGLLIPVSVTLNLNWRDAEQTNQLTIIKGNFNYIWWIIWRTTPSFFSFDDVKNGKSFVNSIFIPTTSPRSSGFPALFKLPDQPYSSSLYNHQSSSSPPHLLEHIKPQLDWLYHTWLYQHPFWPVLAARATWSGVEGHTTETWH